MTGPEAIDRHAAAAQLAAMQADREALADRVVQPWWYDALLWLVLAFPVFAAALVAEEVLDVDGAMVGAGVVLGIAVAVISRWWSRIYVAELRGQR